MVIKKPVSPHSSLSDVSQNTTPFTEVEDSSHGSNVSLNDELEIQGASRSAPSTVKNDSNPRKMENF